jgi:thymidylate kinase
MGNSGSPFVLALRKTADITFLAQAAFVRVLGADAAVTRAMRAQHRSLVLVRVLAEAEGRRRRFVSSRREINQGAVVLYDRYPLGSVAISGLGMDGPRISSIVGEQAGALERRLARREEAVYRRIWPPDHTFVLRVPADVAAARKPADRPARIASKTTALSRIVADQRSISDVDATQPRDAVLLEIKRTLWRLL